MLYWTGKCSRRDAEMKYLVFGAGGTGGSLAAFLAQGGKDV